MKRLLLEALETTQEAETRHMVSVLLATLEGSRDPSCTLLPSLATGAGAAGGDSSSRERHLSDQWPEGSSLALSARDTATGVAGRAPSPMACMGVGLAPRDPANCLASPAPPPGSSLSLTAGADDDTHSTGTGAGAGAGPDHYESTLGSGEADFEQRLDFAREDSEVRIAHNRTQ